MVKWIIVKFNDNKDKQRKIIRCDFLQITIKQFCHGWEKFKSIEVIVIMFTLSFYGIESLSKA